MVETVSGFALQGPASGDAESAMIFIYFRSWFHDSIAKFRRRSHHRAMINSIIRTSYSPAVKFSKSVNRRQ